METSRLSEKNKGKTAVSSRRPADISDWSRVHVRQWMLEINVAEDDADILYYGKINGDALLQLKQAYLLMQKLSKDAKELIFQHKDLQTQQQNEVVTRNLQPRPFSKSTYCYIENGTLDVTETGPIDLIQPCHEFKEFTNTKEEKYRMKKYTYEVIRFAAACMNSRTNGTIHFGVGDQPHGQILGISVPKNDDFDVQQNHAIKRHFKLERQVEIAKRCIKPPQFVEVLKADMAPAGKYVIEVDVEPSSIVCEELCFNTYDINKNEDEKQEPTAEGKKKTKKERKNDESFFIRDGSSSRNLITSASSKEYEKYTATANMQRLSQLRKDAEEKHLYVVKNSVQGSKLCEMITGGTQSMDRSHFASYIVVVNKSHPDQLKNLDFLHHMNLVAVLDFDPQSTENGLNTFFNGNLPAFIWSVFRKGRNPSDADYWLTEKGRDVVSFLCQLVQPRKKLLVIFLLLSQVSDTKDPLLETFNMFLQELNGGNQILCISDNETTYTYWKELIEGRYNVDISRCIYELSFAEVNGTILSLWSENRKSKRFLPCGGGSKVVLTKKTEESLHMLNVLCVNQCEGGNEDKQHHEENFFKGGKVSWWNFFFSEQPGSMPFIKRDKFDYIINTMIPNMQNQTRACVFINILHLPGCGGTTLAMHVLWTLKDKYRCAVLKETTHDYSTAAEQVVKLLTYEAKEKPRRLPVLLMIDHFHIISNVERLQLQIEECLNQNIFSKSPQVIIVNCMRVESCDKFEGTDNTVFIPNSFSETEIKLFREKMEEFKKTNTNTETFYVSMFIKNFSPAYIQGIVKNSMNGFNFQHKHAQLFAVLVLLHVYCKSASLSVSTCEEFLDLQTKAESCKVEDVFGTFSSLLKRCTVDSKVTFEGMMVIHSSVAQHCLEEISTSHGVSKAEIANLLLTTDSFYKNNLGKQKLMQDVHSMLVKRQYSAKDEDFVFSPLIQDIMKETPGMEETVLLNAEKCLTEDAEIIQLLARYYYIKQQDFTEAIVLAKKDNDHSREDSYICDTVSQVLVRELKHAFDEDGDDSIKPDSLDRYLTLAESAAEACKKTQQTANKEALKTRLQRQNEYNTYNTAGHLSELQTAATVIQILQRTTLNSDFTPNNCLSQVLLGKITIEDLSRENPELKQYCDVLRKHKCFLLQLKSTMKQHFDFFIFFFVNLVPFLAEEDKQKKLTKPKVSRYFQQYTDLFWERKTQWIKLFFKHLSNKVKSEQTREYLEMNKGDSYTGLLQYLYEEDSASTLEEIIRQYDFILSSQEASPMDTVNFIYANVILANINHASWCITPYKDLRKLLFETIPHAGEILPLHYITVLLLWQEKNSELPTFVSQMKESYSKELKPVSNGKRAAIHFYLGKVKGYGGLISQRDINSCLGSGQNISTQWDDETIWKQVRDSKKLCRVSGEIRNNWIWVADVNVMVDPMFRSQLHKESGTRVTFFIGFSMNGPVALDIDFESKDSQA